MTSIKLIVTGASAMAEVDGLLTSGMVGIPVTISYDSAWDGLKKTLVCRAGHVVKTILNVRGTATVAHECMVPNQTLFIGIEGRNADGTLVIPTVWARCGLICSGANAEADPSTDPTLPVWAQIESKIGSLDNLNTQAKDSLVAAINEAMTKGGVDPEAVQKIVEDYIASNPPTVTETDPTVPAWAKQPEKPTYTAEEVHALPDTYTPPVDTTLTKPGQAADAAKVGKELSSLSEEKVDKAALGLIIGADGKIYVAINGVAIGSGVEITGGTVEDPTYKVELSDGIILNTLMFQDEFDGDSLSSVWKYQIGQNEAAMNCAFSALSENIAVEDGKLRMTVLKNNPTSDYPYSGARIMSQTFGGADNYGFDTGYAEIRFMLDNPVPGVTPAFWTVGQSQSEVITPTGDYTATRVIHGRSWPWAGEIDILEGYGDDNGSYFSPGIIYQTDPYTDAKQTGKTNTRNDYAANEWHTVGLYKSKDALKFYYDRALVATLDISDNPCFSGVGLKIILNLATGSTWGTIPDDFQQCNMYVDYVRVYSLSNSMSTLADQNTESLLPDCVNGFACVANRSWLLRPQFAENTKNTALYWESDNTGIAKVENGYVTTVSNGDCNIIAKDPDGNTVINFALNVKDNAGILATGITVTSDITTIEAGGSADISANIYPENCDELIPAVTVITGSEYCSVDGLTVTNTNSSGEDKSIVVRVATNNPNVYEDITLTMATGVSFEVSIADGLTNNFQPKQEYIDTASNTIYLIWADSIADDKIYYAQDTSAFDGVKIVKSSTLDAHKLIYKTVFLNGSTEGTFISVLSNIAGGSGWGYVNTVDDIANETKVGHYAGVYFTSASNARCRLMPEYGNHSVVWQVDIGFTSGELLVVVGKIDNGNIEYSLYNASGQIGTTGSKSIAEVVNDSGVIGGVYLGSSNRGNGIKGNVHQHLVYNRVLTDTEISTIASELIALHSGNV